MRCGRCGEDTNIHIMSFFDDRDICMRCDSVERAHPDFKKASTREHQEVLGGNYNFHGVGAPTDLYHRCREAKERFGDDWKAAEEHYKNLQ